MKTLNLYEVKIYFNPRYSFEKEEEKFKVSEVKVLAENEKFLCLEDDYFTKITKNKNWDKIYDTLNKPSISIRTKDSILGEGIFYTLYTTKKKRISTIRKEIEKKIEDDLGSFFKIDLSFLED